MGMSRTMSTAKVSPTAHRAAKAASSRHWRRRSMPGSSGTHMATNTKTTIHCMPFPASSVPFPAALFPQLLRPETAGVGRQPGATDLDVHADVHRHIPKVVVPVRAQLSPDLGMLAADQRAEADGVGLQLLLEKVEHGPHALFHAPGQGRLELGDNGRVSQVQPRLVGDD